MLYSSSSMFNVLNIIFSKILSIYLYATRLSSRNSPTSMQAKVPTGPFGLDMEFLQRIELNAPVKYCNPVLVEPSLSDLNEPVNMLNPPKTQ